MTVLEIITLGLAVAIITLYFIYAFAYIAIHYAIEPNKTLKEGLEDWWNDWT